MSSSAQHLHRNCFVASAILVIFCRQPTTKRFREAAVESSKYINASSAVARTHCPWCASGVVCSVRENRVAHQRMGRVGA